MLTISDHHLHISHIMWQPAFNCVMKDSKGCADCYIKAAPSSFTQGPLNAQIVDLIFGEHPQVSCDQFTLSLDTMSEPNEELVEVVDFILSRVGEPEEGRMVNPPKLCIAVHNHQTLISWAKWTYRNARLFLSPLYMLSLSTFPNNELRCERLQQACKSNNTILNYNRLALHNPNRPPQEFINGCKYSDSVHIIFQKRPLGSPQDPMAYQRFTATGDLARHLAVRVYEDACVSDSKRYLRTGRTCGAAIGKVHVWPDGSVTGCPYDSHHRALAFEPDDMPTNTWNQLRACIEKRQRHPMHLCGIPTVIAR